MLQYKIPGYYVEQLPQQPIPSSPDTALPVIIGYTAKWRDADGNDLRGVPTRIFTLAEFQNQFGGAPGHKTLNLEVDLTNTVTKSTVIPTGFTALSVQAYFENGGQSIVIYSLGSVDQIYEKAHFLDALEVLDKAQDPTLMLAPDAILLPGDDYYAVMQAILSHCKKHQDRFAIVDVPEVDPMSDPVSLFRSKIGAVNLDMGAAYFPWLETNFTKEVTYKDLYQNITRFGSTVYLDEFTNNPIILNQITLLNEAVEDCLKIEGIVDDILNASPSAVLPSGVSSIQTLEEGFLLASELYQAAVINGDLTNAGKNWRLMMRYTYYLLDSFIDACLDPATGEYVSEELYNFIQQIVDNELAQGLGVAFLTPLVVLDNTGTLPAIPFGATTNYPVRNVYQTTGFEWEYIGVDYTSTGPDGWNDTFADYNTDDSGLPYPTPADGQQRIANLVATEQIIYDAWDEVYKQIQLIQEQALFLVKDRQRMLRATLPEFDSILSQAEESLGLLPPSGAVAGIYSLTDEARGIWKAPANTRLNRVKGVSRLYDAIDQEILINDPVGGKSINHIRPFRSKGIRIWGARTLMGNSLEWRFVPVRRLFLQVEKDLRDALRSFLYESNDRSTWVAVKGLVTSYLIRLFKAGAMSGGSPDEAFFVKIGLGETMTSTDVLEGRMILQVGIAAVRPAEFIVLRFIQDLEEA